MFALLKSYVGIYYSTGTLLWVISIQRAIAVKGNFFE
jgi:hypothetical protein